MNVFGKKPIFLGKWVNIKHCEGRSYVTKCLYKTFVANHLNWKLGNNEIQCEICDSASRCFETTVYYDISFALINITY